MTEGSQNKKKENSKSLGSARENLDQFIVLQCAAPFFDAHIENNKKQEVA